MIERRVTIHVDEDRTGAWRLTATISQPFLRGKSINWRPMRTITKTLQHPYAGVLTPKLLTEWINAINLVSAGYYEDIELPFDR